MPYFLPDNDQKNKDGFFMILRSFSKFGLMWSKVGRLTRSHIQADHEKNSGLKNSGERYRDIMAFLFYLLPPSFST